MAISEYQLQKAVTLLRAGREVSVSDGKDMRPLSLLGAALLVDGGAQILPPLLEGQRIQGVDMVFPEGSESVQADPGCLDWEAPEAVRDELRQKIQEIAEIAQNNGIPISVVANIGNYGEEERVIKSAIFPQFSPAVSFSMREPNSGLFSGVI